MSLDHVSSVGMSTEARTLQSLVAFARAVRQYRHTGQGRSVLLDALSGQSL